MAKLLGSSLIFVVLGESAVILILVFIVLYKYCRSCGRRREKKRQQDIARYRDETESFTAGAESRLARRDEENIGTVSREAGTRLTMSTMTSSTNSLGPLITHASMSTQVRQQPTSNFQTYRDMYRAQSVSASSIAGTSDSPYAYTGSDADLLRPPSAAYLSSRPHEVSRLTISTLLDDYAKEDPEQGREQEQEQEQEEKRSSTPLTTALSYESEGMFSMKTSSTLPPSYRTRRSEQELHTYHNNAPPSSYPSQTTVYMTEGAPSSTSVSAPTRGRRSASVSSRARAPLDDPDQSSKLARSQTQRGSHSRERSRDGRNARRAHLKRSMDGGIRLAGGPMAANAQHGGQIENLAGHPPSYF